MGDVSARDKERIQFAFSIFDSEGKGEIDACYQADLLRALNLNPTNAVIEKLGLNVRRNTKKIKMDDFLPIFSTVKKDKDAGSFEDFIEILKLYDKQENGTIMYAELEHILCSLGERFEKDDIIPVLKETCDEEDEEGCIPYAPFVKRLLAFKIQ